METNLLKICVYGCVPAQFLSVLDVSEPSLTAEKLCEHDGSRFYALRRDVSSDCCTSIDMCLYQCVILSVYLALC